MNIRTVQVLHSIDVITGIIFGISLFVTIILFIKNVIIDKKPIFTILMNLIFVSLTIPCLKAAMTLREDVYIGPGVSYPVYFSIINVITIIILFILKKKYKFKNGMGYLIANIIMMIMGPMSSIMMSSAACVLYSGESARNLLITNYIIVMAEFFINVNLVISFINANWNCFIKKKEEISDREE